MAIITRIPTTRQVSGALWGSVLITPQVLDGPMNSESFQADARQFLVPTLRVET